MTSTLKPGTTVRAGRITGRVLMVLHGVVTIQTPTGQFVRRPASTVAL